MKCHSLMKWPETQQINRVLRQRHSLMKCQALIQEWRYCVGLPFLSPSPSPTKLVYPYYRIYYYYFLLYVQVLYVLSSWMLLKKGWSSTFPPLPTKILYPEDGFRTRFLREAGEVLSWLSVQPLPLPFPPTPSQSFLKLNWWINLSWFAILRPLVTFRMTTPSPSHRFSIVLRYLPFPPSPFHLVVTLGWWFFLPDVTTGVTEARQLLELPT